MTPRTHVAFFQGGPPCDHTGTVIKAIQHSESTKELELGLVANRSFSNKPSSGYANFYEKMTRYIAIISAPALSLQPSADPRTMNIVKSVEFESPFVYEDTNSTRAEINAITAKLTKLRIAIVGLGGTGSYVLDAVAKTPVYEIHIFDGDLFKQHNAFRSPGAATAEEITKKPLKVEYLKRIYSSMHKRIIEHPYFITEKNLNELDAFDFIFVSIDGGDGTNKREIVQFLIRHGVPFVDTGLGVRVNNDRLAGTVRVTTITRDKNGHWSRRIPFNERADDEYDTNIQISELNMLNAAMAVLKWKKLFGVYEDLGNEFETKYTVRTNDLLSEDTFS